MYKKIILTFLLLLVTFVLSPHSVFSEGDNLLSGVLIGDDDGFRVESDGYYFIEEDNIIPGYQFTRKISIGNYSERLDKPISIEMKVDYDKHPPVVKGRENLLSLIQVTYSLDGKVLYKGSLDGSGEGNKRDKSQPIKLGSFKRGDTGTLLAEFTVPQTVDLRNWGDENSVEYYTVFDVKTDPSEKEPEKKKLGLARILPHTGEDLSYVLLGMSIGFLIITLIVRVRLTMKKT